MSTRSKVRIYKAIVKPAMTHVVEIKAENSTTERLLRTAKLRT